MLDKQAWRLLLIDAHNEDYVLTLEKLQGAQYGKVELEWAPTYDSGYQRLSQAHYDAVLVDYDLGPHTGIELIREWVTRKYPAPLILYTGRGSFEMDDEAMHAGAAFYLPIIEATPLLLERSLRYAIERHQIEARLVATTDQQATQIAESKQVETELRRIKKELQGSDNLYRMLFNSLLDGFALHEIICDANGNPIDYRFLEVNPAFEQLTGLKGKDILGKTVREVMPQIEASWIERYGEVALTGKPAQFENYAEQLQKYYEVVAFSPYKNQFAAIFSDITERRHAEQALQTLNRTLRVLSTCDQRLIHAPDETTLLNEVCNIIYQDCNYAMVWIGYAEENESRSVRPAAVAGFEAGYLETLNLTWADTDRGRGPTGTAIRSGQACLCRNMLTDPNFLPWREQAIQRGYASSIALPLKSSGKTLGALMIYSKEPDPFSTDEVSLLTELAGDLAYGITTIRLREAKARADKALQESEQRLQLALQVAKIGTFEWNIQSGENHWTAEMEAIHGLPPGSIARTQSAWEQFVHPEDRAEIFRRVEQTMEPGNPGESEWRVIWPDGSPHWITGRWQVLSDERGLPVRVVGVNMDISERKQAESRSGYLASFPEQNPNPIIEVDLEGNIAYANPAAQQLFPTLKEQKLAHPWLADWESVGLKFGAGQTRAFEREIIVGERAYQQTCHLISQERLVRIYGMDITARKHAEQALQENYQRLQFFAKQLESSNQELEDFAFIASHDLQEPLRKILAFGSLLKSNCCQDLDEKGQDYINRMQQAAERMRTMVDDLLTYSRLGTQNQLLGSANLSKIAAEVLIDLEARITQTGGKVEIDDLPVIKADPLHMRQLLQNLIGNALKYHRSGVSPQVKVSCKPISIEQVELVVEDNGIGFDMKYADQLFQPFRRLHGRAEYEGTGMGLAICRKIVEQYGGRITTHSVPDQGATFMVTLPLSAK